MPGRRDRVVRGLPDPEPVEPVAEPPAEKPDRPRASPRRRASRSSSVNNAVVPDGAEEGDAAPVSSPYVGAARSPRTLRIYDPLYARVGALARALEDDGYSTDRTELIQAVLHFELPEDATAARKLLRRWRRYLVD